MARRPDHWFAATPTLGRAMADPRVAASVGRLQGDLPAGPGPAAIAPLRGPGRARSRAGRPSLARVLEDLSLTPRGPADAPCADDLHALPFPVPAGRSATHGDPDGSLAVLYLTVLLAMAVLLRTVIEPATRDTARPPDAAPALLTPRPYAPP